MKKLLIVGIIALFIGLAFIPSFNAISNSEDSTPPVTTISLNGPHSELGIYTGDVTVTLNATDDISGVFATYYNLDISGNKTYYEPFIVTGHSEHTLAYWSVDNAGNEEKTQFAYINIDLISPEIDLLLDILDNRSIKFEPYILEIGSGLWKVEYYIDNNHLYTKYGANSEWIWTPNITGRHLVSGIAYDKANNSNRDDSYINIPREKSISSSFFLRFLDRYPLLNRLLQKLTV